MSQRIGTHGTIFNTSGGLSGVVAITQRFDSADGAGTTVNIPAADLLDFVAEHVRQERIESLQQATSESILGLVRA